METVIVLLSVIIVGITIMSEYLIVYDAIHKTEIFENVKPFVLIATLSCCVAMAFAFYGILR